MKMRISSQKVLSSPGTRAEFPLATSLKGFKSHMGVRLQDMGYWWPQKYWETIGLDGLGELFQSYQFCDVMRIGRLRFQT